jgi:hypothetical protein
MLIEEWSRSTQRGGVEVNSATGFRQLRVLRTRWAWGSAMVQPAAVAGWTV